MSNSHGQWQAQGDDVPGRGHVVGWTEVAVPTRDQGLRWLGDVIDMCTARQRRTRDRAYRDAKRYVERAPGEGYPTMILNSANSSTAETGFAFVQCGLEGPVLGNPEPHVRWRTLRSGFPSLPPLKHHLEQSQLAALCRLEVMKSFYANGDVVKDARIDLGNACSQPFDGRPSVC